MEVKHHPVGLELVDHPDCDEGPPTQDLWVVHQPKTTLATPLAAASTQIVSQSASATWHTVTRATQTTLNVLQDHRFL